MESTDSPQPEPRPGGNARSSTRRRLINLFRWLLLIAVIAAAAYAVYINWTGVSQTLVEMKPLRVAVSFVVLLVGIAASAMSWQVLLDDLGPPIGVGRGAQIYLVGMLGKYLPGSVWAYLLQLELGRKAGLARARVFATTVFSLIVVTVASLLAGALAIPELVALNPDLAWLNWLYLLLPLGLVFLHPKLMTAVVRFGFRILRRPRPDHPITFRVVVTSMAWALLSYSLYGVHLWLLADTGEGINIGELGISVGAMGVAMTAGLAAFLLPSGAGARELVIVTALTPVTGVEAGLAVALVSRLMFTVGEMILAGGSAVMAIITRRRRGEYSGELPPE